MALSIPILEEIKPFDANDTYDFHFRYDRGGSQYTKSNLVISTNRGDGSDLDIYDIELDSYDPFHTYVPSLATLPLENGKEYKAKIRVGTEELWSEFSEWQLFYAHSLPVVKIVNISEDGHIYSHIDTFQVSYEVPPQERDPLESYQFTLYDSEMRLINKYPKKYANTPMIEQTIKDLEPNRQYILTLRTESQHGVVVNLTEEFIPTYDFPILGETTFLVENLKDKPSVRVAFEVYQIDGTIIGDEHVSFSDNTWVNLSGKVVRYDTDFHIDDDFIMKLWCKGLNEGRLVCEISDNNGSTLELSYLRNRIHVYKYRNNSPHSSYVVCDTEIDGLENVFIMVKQVDNMINIVCQQQ